MRRRGFLKLLGFLPIAIPALKDMEWDGAVPAGYDLPPAPKIFSQLETQCTHCTRRLTIPYLSGPGDAPKRPYKIQAEYPCRAEGCRGKMIFDVEVEVSDFRAYWRED